MTEQHPITPPDDTFYEFTVSNDGFFDVSGSAPTLSEAIEEGKHYLAQYSQDGHYTLEVRRAEVVYKLSTEQLITRSLEDNR